jgi:hypothetical protein
VILGLTNISEFASGPAISTLGWPEIVVPAGFTKDRSLPETTPELAGERIES